MPSIVRVLTPETPLRARASRLIERCLRLAAVDGNEGLLYDELLDCRERLRQPMRVAVVGLTNAGKSTLLNALLEEVVVPTGPIENTYTITWLRHGSTPGVTVHFKDGRPTQTKDASELAELVEWQNDVRALDLIRFVEVRRPNAILSRLDLIDTPGFASPLVTGTDTTRSFLQAHGNELSTMTEDEAAKADAVLYLFSQSVHMSDEAVIEQFQGPASGRATPFNSIGVLTKADVYWEPGVDPIAAATKITTRLKSHPKVRSLLYSLIPVSGLLALGAATLTETSFETLRKFAVLTDETVLRALRNASRFVERPVAGLDAKAADRQALVESLGMYGIWLATRCLRDGADDRPALSRALLQQSGVPQLREMLISHFGGRADLIKIESAFRRVEAAAFRDMRRSDGATRRRVERIAGAFSAFRNSQHGFDELDVLKSYYDGKLVLSLDETEDLLNVIGERGTSFNARLGVDDGASRVALRRVAAEKNACWYAKANDFSPMSQEMRIATTTISRTYELILFALEKTREK